MKSSSLHTSRQTIADTIVRTLTHAQAHLQAEFQQPDRIPSFSVDQVLPADLVQTIYEAFPSPEQLIYLNDLREKKYVGIQMNQFHPILEEIIYAFQQPAVVEMITAITGMPDLLPDSELYAGGISRMEQGGFLNPHLDNSHDRTRTHYRVLNLLFYVSPHWQVTDGGHLELWDHGLKQPCRTIHYCTNRLVVMQTNRRSWHSVSPIHSADPRCCINNYYFSPHPAEDQAYYHATSFRAKSTQPWRDRLLQFDGWLRNHLPTDLKDRIRKPHYFQSKSSK